MNKFYSIKRLISFIVAVCFIFTSLPVDKAFAYSYHSNKTLIPPLATAKDHHKIREDEAVRAIDNEYAMFPSEASLRSYVQNRYGLEPSQYTLKPELSGLLAMASPDKPLVVVNAPESALWKAEPVYDNDLATYVLDEWLTGSIERQESQLKDFIEKSYPHLKKFSRDIVDKLKAIILKDGVLKPFILIENDKARISGLSDENPYKEYRGEILILKGWLLEEFIDRTFSEQSGIKDYAQLSLDAKQLLVRLNEMRTVYEREIKDKTGYSQGEREKLAALLESDYSALLISITKIIGGLKDARKEDIKDARTTCKSIKGGLLPKFKKELDGFSIRYDVIDMGRQVQQEALLQQEAEQQKRAKAISQRLDNLEKEYNSHGANQEVVVSTYLSNFTALEHKGIKLYISNEFLDEKENAITRLKNIIDRLLDEFPELEEIFRRNKCNFAARADQKNPSEIFYSGADSVNPLVGQPNIMFNFSYPDEVLLKLLRFASVSINVCEELSKPPFSLSKDRFGYLSQLNAISYITYKRSKKYHGLMDDDARREAEKSIKKLEDELTQAPIRAQVYDSFNGYLPEEIKALYEIGFEHNNIGFAVSTEFPVGKRQEAQIKLQGIVDEILQQYPHLKEVALRNKVNFLVAPGETGYKGFYLNLAKPNSPYDSYRITVDTSLPADSLETILIMQLTILSIIEEFKGQPYVLNNQQMTELMNSGCIAYIAYARIYNNIAFIQAGALKIEWERSMSREGGRIRDQQVKNRTVKILGDNLPPELKLVFVLDFNHRGVSFAFSDNFIVAGAQEFDVEQEQAKIKQKIDETFDNFPELAAIAKRHNIKIILTPLAQDAMFFSYAPSGTIKDGHEIAVDYAVSQDADAALSVIYPLILVSVREEFKHVKKANSVAFDKLAQAGLFDFIAYERAKKYLDKGALTSAENKKLDRQLDVVRTCLKDHGNQEVLERLFGQAMPEELKSLYGEEIKYKEIRIGISNNIEQDQRDKAFSRMKIIVDKFLARFPDLEKPIKKYNIIIRADTIFVQDPLDMAETVINLHYSDEILLFQLMHTILSIKIYTELKSFISSNSGVVEKYPYVFDSNVGLAQLAGLIALGRHDSYINKINLSAYRKKIHTGLYKVMLELFSKLGVPLEKLAELESDFSALANKRAIAPELAGAFKNIIKAIQDQPAGLSVQEENLRRRQLRNKEDDFDYFKRNGIKLAISKDFSADAALEVRGQLEKLADKINAIPYPALKEHLAKPDTVFRAVLIPDEPTGFNFEYDFKEKRLLNADFVIDFSDQDSPIFEAHIISNVVEYQTLNEIFQLPVDLEGFSSNGKIFAACCRYISLTRVQKLGLVDDKIKVDYASELAGFAAQLLEPKARTFVEGIFGDSMPAELSSLYGRDFEYKGIRLIMSGDFDDSQLSGASQRLKGIIDRLLNIFPQAVDFIINENIPVEAFSFLPTHEINDVRTLILNFYLNDEILLQHIIGSIFLGKTINKLASFQRIISEADLIGEIANLIALVNAEDYYEKLSLTASQKSHYKKSRQTLIRQLNSKGAALGVLELLRVEFINSAGRDPVLFNEFLPLLNKIINDLNDSADDIDSDDQTKAHIDGLIVSQDHIHFEYKGIQFAISKEFAEDKYDEIKRHIESLFDRLINLGGVNIADFLKRTNTIVEVSYDPAFPAKRAFKYDLMEKAVKNINFGIEFSSLNDKSYILRIIKHVLDALVLEEVGATIPNMEELRNKKEVIQACCEFISLSRLIGHFDEITFIVQADRTKYEESMRAYAKVLKTPVVRNSVMAVFAEHLPQELRELYGISSEKIEPQDSPAGAADETVIAETETGTSKFTEQLELFHLPASEYFNLPAGVIKIILLTGRTPDGKSIYNDVKYPKWENLTNIQKIAVRIKWLREKILGMNKRDDLVKIINQLGIPTERKAPLLESTYYNYEFLSSKPKLTQTCPVYIINYISELITKKRADAFVDAPKIDPLWIIGDAVSDETKRSEEAARYKEFAHERLTEGDSAALLASINEDDVINCILKNLGDFNKIAADLNLYKYELAAICVSNQQFRDLTSRMILLAENLEAELVAANGNLDLLAEGVLKGIIGDEFLKQKRKQILTDALLEKIIGSESLLKIYDQLNEPVKEEEPLSDNLQADEEEIPQIAPAIAQLWPDIYVMIVGKGIKRVFVDLDDTLFRAMGVIASDKWVGNRINEVGYWRTHNEFEQNEVRMIRNKFFELTETGLQDILKQLNEANIEIIGVTARLPQYSARTEEILENLGVGVYLKKVVYTAGAGRKKDAIKKIIEDGEKNGGQAQIKSVFIDNKAETAQKVSNDRFLREHGVSSIHYINTPEYETKNYKSSDYFKLAKDAMKEERYGHTLEFYLNALEVSPQLGFDERIKIYSEISDQIEALKTKLDVSDLELAFLINVTRLLFDLQSSRYDSANLDELVKKYAYKFSTNPETFVEFYSKGLIRFEKVDHDRIEKGEEYLMRIDRSNTYLFIEPILRYILDAKPDMILIADTGARPFAALIQEFIKLHGLQDKVKVQLFPASIRNAGDTAFEMRRWLELGKAKFEGKAINGGSDREIAAEFERFFKDGDLLKDKNVVLVDDNICSGITIETMNKVLASFNVKSLVVATPFIFGNKSYFKDFSIIESFNVKGDFVWKTGIRKQRPPLSVLTEWEDDKTILEVQKRERNSPPFLDENKDPAVGEFNDELLKNFIGQLEEFSKSLENLKLGDITPTSPGRACNSLEERILAAYKGREIPKEDAKADNLPEDFYLYVIRADGETETVTLKREKDPKQLLEDYKNLIETDEENIDKLLNPDFVNYKIIIDGVYKGTVQLFKVRVDDLSDGLLLHYVQPTVDFDLDTEDFFVKLMDELEGFITGEPYSHLFVPGQMQISTGYKSDKLYLISDTKKLRMLFEGHYKDNRDKVGGVVFNNCDKFETSWHSSYRIIKRELPPLTEEEERLYGSHIAQLKSLIEKDQPIAFTGWERNFVEEMVETIRKGKAISDQQQNVIERLKSRAGLMLPGIQQWQSDFLNTLNYLTPIPFGKWARYDKLRYQALEYYHMVIMPDNTEDSPPQFPGGWFAEEDGLYRAAGALEAVMKNSNTYNLAALAREDFGDVLPLWKAFTSNAISIANIIYHGQYEELDNGRIVAKKLSSIDDIENWKKGLIRLSSGRYIEKDGRIYAIADDINHGQLLMIFDKKDFNAESFRLRNEYPAPQRIYRKDKLVDLALLDIIGAYEGRQVIPMGRNVSATIHVTQGGSAVVRAGALTFAIPAQNFAQKAQGLDIDGRDVIIEIGKDVNQGLMIYVVLKEDYSEHGLSGPLAVYHKNKPVDLYLKDLSDLYFGRKVNLKIRPDHRPIKAKLSQKTNKKGFVDLAYNGEILRFEIDALPGKTINEDSGKDVLIEIKEDPDFGCYIDLYIDGVSRAEYLYRGKVTAEPANIALIALYYHVRGIENIHNRPVKPRRYCHNEPAEGNFMDLSDRGNRIKIRNLEVKSGSYIVLDPQEFNKKLNYYPINIYENKTYENRVSGKPTLVVVRDPLTGEFISEKEFLESIISSAQRKRFDSVKTNVNLRQIINEFGSKLDPILLELVIMLCDEKIPPNKARILLEEYMQQDSDSQKEAEQVELPLFGFKTPKNIVNDPDKRERWVIVLTEFVKKQIYRRIDKDIGLLIDADPSELIAMNEAMRKLEQVMKSKDTDTCLQEAYQVAYKYYTDVLGYQIKGINNPPNEPLRLFQREAIKTLSEIEKGGHGVILGHDPRLGKTIMFLASCIQRKAKNVLIIVPGAAKDVWKKTVLDWTDQTVFLLDSSDGKGQFFKGKAGRGKHAVKSHGKKRTMDKKEGKRMKLEDLMHELRGGKRGGETLFTVVTYDALKGGFRFIYKLLKNEYIRAYGKKNGNTIYELALKGDFNGLYKFLLENGIEIKNNGKDIRGEIKGLEKGFEGLIENYEYTKEELVLRILAVIETTIGHDNLYRDILKEVSQTGSSSARNKSDRKLAKHLRRKSKDEMKESLYENVTNEVEKAYATFDIIKKLDDPQLSSQDIRFEIIAADEAHRIASKDSLQSKATTAINKTPIRHLITATPITGRDHSQLWRLLNWINPLEPEFADEKKFLATYEETPDGRWKLYQFLVKNEYLIRREKDDVLKDIIPGKRKFGDKDYQIIWAELDAAAKRTYKRIHDKETFSEWLSSLRDEAGNVVYKDHRYNQYYIEQLFTSGIVYETDVDSFSGEKIECGVKDSVEQDSLGEISRYNGKKKYFIVNNPKMEKLRAIIDEKLEKNQKVIIFTRFPSVCAALSEVLVRKYEERYEKDFVYSMHGGLSVNKRTQIKDEFVKRSGPAVLIATYPTASESINLISEDENFPAATIVLWDLDWTPPNQAVERINGFKQKELVEVYYLVCNSWIDKHILDVQSEKSQILDAVIKGLMPKDISSEYKPADIQQIYDDYQEQMETMTSDPSGQADTSRTVAGSMPAIQNSLAVSISCESPEEKESSD